MQTWETYPCHFLQPKFSNLTCDSLASKIAAPGVLYPVSKVDCSSRPPALFRNSFASSRYCSSPARHDLEDERYAHQENNKKDRCGNANRKVSQNLVAISGKNRRSIDPYKRTRRLVHPRRRPGKIVPKSISAGVHIRHHLQSLAFGISIASWVSFRPVIQRTSMVQSILSPCRLFRHTQHQCRRQRC